MFEKVLAISTAHMPGSEPNFGDLRAEEHEYGYIVFAVQEKFFEDFYVPDWIRPIILAAAREEECTCIIFDAGATISEDFPTWDW